MAFSIAKGNLHGLHPRIRPKNELRKWPVAAVRGFRDEVQASWRKATSAWAGGHVLDSSYMPADSARATYMQNAVSPRRPLKQNSMSSIRGAGHLQYVQCWSSWCSLHVRSGERPVGPRARRGATDNRQPTGPPPGRGVPRMYVLIDVCAQWLRPRVFLGKAATHQLRVFN